MSEAEKNDPAAANDGAAQDGAGPRKPSKQEFLRPVELVGGSAIFGVFVGLVVLFATRELILSAIFLGVAFIVSLIVLAMFALSFKPNAAEKQDLDEQNREATDREQHERGDSAH